MNNRGWFMEFLVTGIVTLVVTILVTLIWNLIAHRVPMVDWATSFRLAIILGIALPTVNRMAGRAKKP